VEDIFKIFWFLPNMNNLFQSKSKDRRDFIDAMISSLDRTHNKRIKTYENLQRQRISILKDFSTKKSNIRWLDIIEREMASQAVVISEKRMNLYDLLNQILDDQIEQLPRIKVFATSGIEEQLKNVPALTIEEEICKQLTENRKIDGLIGKTRYSAISSDFKVQNFEKNTDARNCSTGEQKVILLSIFFSFIKMLKKQDIKEIIFLLDDIFSNLDQRYAELILRSLSELNVQTWITDIEMKIINEKSIFYNQTKFINIEDIQVKK
jgi:DNA replication and repair protein RecF